jgi:hypothetical protein
MHNYHPAAAARDEPNFVCALVRCRLFSRKFSNTQRQRVFVLSAMGKSVSEQLNIDQIDYSVGYGSQHALARVNNMLMRQNCNFVSWKLRWEWIRKSNTKANNYWCSNQLLV